MFRTILWLSFLMLSGRVAASPSYDYVPSTGEVIVGPHDLLAACHEIMQGYKSCQFSLQNDGAVGDFEIADVVRGSSETGLYIDRKFVAISDDVRISINDLEIPIPDGDGVFFVPLPMNMGSTVTIRLTSPFSGRQTFDRAAEALLRSVTLIKSNSHYMSLLVSKLPGLKDSVEQTKQQYLQIRRNLRFLNFTKESARDYLTSILGRDATDLSGDCLEPFSLQPEECSVLGIIVGILKGETPGITDQDRQIAFTAFTLATGDLGRALATLQKAELEYGDQYRRAYADAYNLLLQETSK
jgi:hypothetical protein